jgi:hypothetical protein
MADTGTVTLSDQVTRFFAELEHAPEAAAPVRPYPLDVLITTPESRVAIELREGQAGTATDDVEPYVGGYWTYELRGERAVVDAILAGAVTMGEAMYAGLLVAPEEKSKHNLSSALGQAIRLLQESHRRALDPRNA